MKQRRLSLLLILSLIFASEEATLAKDSIPAEAFTPHGKAFATVFFNFHSDFTGGEHTSSEFQIQRAYLGYKYKLSKEFSAKVNLDVGHPADGGKLDYTAYLKNAYVQYSKNGLKVQAGMIGTKNFKASEKMWGHRYLFKSFQDQYKYASSADAGISAEYKINDFISADIMVRNGEGYKKVQADSSYNTGIGVSIFPIDGLTVRGYYDIGFQAENETILSLFAGYKARQIKIGAEYNMLTNKNYIKEQDQHGFSGFVTLMPTSKIEAFARFDYLTSNTIGNATENWNDSHDGTQLLVGAAYKFVKGFRASLNYRGWTPAESVQEYVPMVYANFELKF